MSASNQYPGHRLGLPVHGPGSLAGFWRRVGGICTDWAIALFLANPIVALLSRIESRDDSAYFNLVTLLIFALIQWIFVAFPGFAPGHRLFGIRVIRLDARPNVGLWRSLLRVSMILLVLPPTIWDADGRGLHDKAAGTVLVRI
ncbi:MAG: hypothetical protein RL670_614 [Actinomycetota bacterium]|jgi:uncharacterized RDD family membrane protein YckC